MGCSGSRAIPTNDEFEIQRKVTKKSLDDFINVLNKKIDLNALKTDLSKLNDLNQLFEDIKLLSDILDVDLKKLKDILAKQKEAKDKLVPGKEKIIEQMSDESVKNRKKFVDNLVKELEGLGLNIKDLGIEDLLKI
jgi:hypothetical protein